LIGSHFPLLSFFLQNNHGSGTKTNLGPETSLSALPDRKLNVNSSCAFALAFSHAEGFMNFQIFQPAADVNELQPDWRCWFSPAKASKTQPGQCGRAH